MNIEKRTANKWQKHSDLINEYWKIKKEINNFKPTSAEHWNMSARLEELKNQLNF